eukprot:11953024-Alexandrium_andersonii.AAC.1
MRLWQGVSNGEVRVSCAGALAAFQHGRHESLMRRVKSTLAQPGTARVAGCPGLISHSGLE